MKSPPAKLNWLDRAVAVYNFHVEQLRTEPKWTVEKSAKALNRSLGSVSQDILLASWFRTHEKQLRRFNSMKEALIFVRTRQREIRIIEIDM